jgi:FimV-like protein
METPMQTHDQTNNTTTCQMKLRTLPTLISCRPIASFLGSCLLAGLFVSPGVLAADKQYTVQSGDTLGKIVRNQYPEVARQSYSIVMDTIVENNPKAFINGNKNSLKLGADLLLVDKEKIEGLKPKPKEVTPAERIQELENKLKQANQQIEQLKAGGDVASTTQEATNKEDRQAEDSEQLQTLKASQEKLQAELKTAQDEISSLKTQLEEAKAEKATTDEQEKEVQVLMTRISEIEAEKEKLQADFATTQKQAQAKSESDEASAEKIATLEAEIASLKKQQDDAKQKQAQEKTETETVSAEKIASLEAEIDSLNKQLEEAKSASKPDDVAKIETLTSKIAELETQNQQLQTDLTAQQETLKAGTNAEKASADKIQALNAQLQEAQAKVETLTAQIKEQEGQITELTTNARKVQEGSLSAEEAEALQGQVDQLATLAEKYEQDIETLQAQLDKKQSEDPASSGEGNTGSSEDVEALKAQVEQLTALAEKYETDLDALQGEGGSGNTAEQSQENTEAVNALKAELEGKNERISELENQVNDFTLANADLAKQLENAGGSNKWLLWLLPILGLLGGSYLLSSRLRKRADEEAAAELKSVMASAEAVVEKSLEEKEVDNVEAGIKLDIAKAYLELSNSAAAHEMLQEVLREGSTSQQEKAEKLLETIQ